MANELTILERNAEAVSTVPRFTSIMRAARYASRRHELGEVATFVLAPGEDAHPAHPAVGTSQAVALAATPGFAGGDLLLALPDRGASVVLTGPASAPLLARVLGCRPAEALALAQLVQELARV
jgi:hypothetical protein